jgi:hypothetical protein
MIRKQSIPAKLLFLAVCFLAIQCSNESKEAGDKKETPGLKAQDLTADDIVGIYTITAAKIRTGGTEQDVYDRMDYCQKHNTYGFNKDGVWYLGGVAGDSCTGPDESGSSSLQGDQLTIDSKQSGIYQYKILSLQNKVLQVSSDASQNGNQATYITSFTKQ